MRYLAIISIIGLLASGCVEGYPGWSVIDIPAEDLPRAVNSAFREDFPETHITRVERSTFESGLSGRPRKHRIFFEKSGSGTQRVIYNSAGKQVEGFDFWFERRPPNNGTAANRRPARQSDGSGNWLATCAADRAFPAAVVELGL
jgi:hypothetical protein